MTRDALIRSASRSAHVSGFGIPLDCIGHRRSDGIVVPFRLRDGQPMEVVDDGVVRVDFPWLARRRE